LTATLRAVDRPGYDGMVDGDDSEIQAAHDGEGGISTSRPAIFLFNLIGGFGMIFRNLKAAFIGVLLGASALGGLTNTAGAATVLSESHYQKSFTLNCSGIICKTTTPTIAAKRQLIIEQITCDLVGGPNGAIVPGYFTVLSAANVVAYKKLLTPAFRNSDTGLNIGYYAYDQRASILFAAGQHGEIGVAHTSGAITAASCDISGRMQVLQ
jgi:hypothetical protein